MPDPTDKWDGDEYLSKPRALEAGALNASSLLDAVRRSLPSPLNTLHALEVGAGPGTVTPNLVALASVHAIEPSASMAATLARQVAPLPNVTFSTHTLSPGSGASFAKGEAQASPTAEEPERTVVPRARYDVAFSTLVAHHVDDLAAFFAGIRAVLVEGGLFVLVEFAHGPDGEDLSVEYHHEEDPTMEAVDDDDQTITEDQFRATWTPRQLASLLERYGFQEVDVRPGRSIPVFGREAVPTLVATARNPGEYVGTGV